MQADLASAASWYQSPLGAGALLAIIAAALTVIATRILDSRRLRQEARERQREREEETRLRREALLMAFYGEVRAVRNFLWSTAERCRWCIELNQEPEIKSFSVPDAVFRSQAGNLGDLGDSMLVASIVEVYSVVQTMSQSAAQIERDNGPALEVVRFLQDLPSGLEAIINLEAWLRKHTKHQREFSPTVNRAEFAAEYARELRTLDDLPRRVQDYRNRVAERLAGGSTEE